MATEFKKINQRLDALEDGSKDEVAILVEILANMNFFGELKRENCNLAKNGQCEFFMLMKPSKDKIPIANECRIDDCKEPRYHYHLEVSNVTCSFCQIIEGTKYPSKLRNRENSESV
jgi:hypothetical protein